MAKRKSAKRGSRKPRKSSLPVGYTMFGGRAKSATKTAFMEACEKQGVPTTDRMEAAMQAYIRNPAKVTSAPAAPKPAAPKPAAAPSPAPVSAPAPAPATPKQETQEVPPKGIFSPPPPKPPFNPYVPYREPTPTSEKKPESPSP